MKLSLNETLILINRESIAVNTHVVVLWRKVRRTTPGRSAHSRGPVAQVQDITTTTTSADPVRGRPVVLLLCVILLLLLVLLLLVLMLLMVVLLLMVEVVMWRRR